MVKSRVLRSILCGLVVIASITCVCVAVLLSIHHRSDSHSGETEKEFERLLQEHTSLANLEKRHAVRILNRVAATRIARQLARNKQETLLKITRYAKTGLIQIDGSSTVFVFFDERDVLSDFELGGQ